MTYGDSNTKKQKNTHGTDLTHSQQDVSIIIFVSTSLLPLAEKSEIQSFALTDHVTEQVHSNSNSTHLKEVQATRNSTTAY